jgi:hypothetical protein
MKHDPFDFSGTGGDPATDHKVGRAERLRPGEYTPEFLRDLQEMQSVYVAPAQWDGNVSAVPPSATWVLHPNGELQRIRFSSAV